MPTGAAGPVANEPLEISPTPTPPPPPQTIESAPPNMPPTSLYLAAFLQALPLLHPPKEGNGLCSSVPHAENSLHMQIS